MEDQKILLTEDEVKCDAEPQIDLGISRSLYPKQDVTFDGVVCSPALRQVYETARMVARTDVPVLITGESGVGKEVLARFIHQHSERGDKPLVRVNCAALPNELLESELFGYDRGAFTGATGEKPGKFELANGGAILLDEITEMSRHLQAKLLHVLQDGEYCRLGGKRSMQADARILACTNRRLEDAVECGEFRDDLYFRLNVIRVEIPPLRERKEEIAPLSNHFVRKYRDKYLSPVSQLPPDLLRRFLQYDWPGNIRELENAIKRYLILLRVDIPISLPSHSPSIAPKTVDAVPEIQGRPQSVRMDFSPLSLKEVGILAAEQAEREMVLQTLEQTNWNRKLAARQLNICYKALLNRIKKWHIRRTSAGKPPMPGRRRPSRPAVNSEKVFADTSTN
jgi:transcriptional regulator with PAS, ATPase and Fis domain